MEGAESPLSEPKSILALVLFSKPRLPLCEPGVEPLDGVLGPLAEGVAELALRKLRFGVKDDQKVFVPDSKDLNL